MTNNAPKHTLTQSAAYQRLFDHFNERLFSGELPQVLLNFSRKSKRTLGFFAPKRWTDGASVIHELSLNPDNLMGRDPKDVLSTLVHEMAHLWQEAHGKKGDKRTRGYHDREWGAKMEAIGLMPSNTGAEGGKKTGVQMTHYVIAGGPFDKVVAEALEFLPFLAAPFPDKEKRQRNKVKYSCKGCGTNAWGKPEINIECGDCQQPFEVVS